MKTKDNWTSMPNCDRNAGVACDSPGCCKSCGWNPAEHKRRLNVIRAGNLRTKDGKKYLYISGREGSPNALQ